MIWRFSIYGFLKNQRYFEPFLYLYFLENGLTFFQVGLLIGFREACVNLLEVPSGAAADLYGRRRVMIFAFSSYVGSFLIFATATTFGALLPAMLLYAVGDAFRTGTHKAIIFDWLAQQDRLGEKTRVYGFTRSWSKMGSAVSVLIAAALVFYTGSYADVFWFSIPPYLLGIVNFLGYPRVLDGPKRDRWSLRDVFAHFRHSLSTIWHSRPLRRLVVESMGFEGVFKASKDYLQPVLQQMAVALPIMLALASQQRTAVLVGLVYFVLHLLSSFASRSAHRVARGRGDTAASRLLWLVYLGLFIVLTAALAAAWHALVVVCFVGLAVVQNLWRPMLVSRFGDHAPPEMGATVLSVESQSRSLAAVVIAPLLGFWVDGAGFWPVGAMGGAVAVIILASFYRRRTQIAP